MTRREMRRARRELRDSQQRKKVVEKRYAIQDFVRSDGRHETYAMVPLNEAVTLADVERKRSTIAKISSALRGMFYGKTDHDDYKMTTEIGFTPVIDAADGFFMSQYGAQSEQDNTRHARYKDYDKMDVESVELSRALTVTKYNTFAGGLSGEESYTVESESEEVVNITKDVDDRTDMREELPGICRSMLKYGDDFEEIVIDAVNRLVVRLNWLNQKYMYRHEDEYRRLRSDAAFTMRGEDNTVNIKFAPWQVVHLRHDHQRGDLYGRSFWHTSRYPFRMKHPMENSLVVARVVRAPRRYAYFIPVPENADEYEVQEILEQAKSKLKRKSMVDSSTGKVSTRIAPMGDDNDIFLPTTKDVKPDVRQLEGADVGGNMQDIEYFQNKEIMSTGVPKSYLGLERDVNAKATLSWEDIEYARQIRGIQSEIAWFQRRVYNIQFYLSGFEISNDLYTVTYPPISFINEEMRMRVMRTQWEIAALAKGLGVPLRWVLKEIIYLSDDKVEEIMLDVEDNHAVVQPQAGQPWQPIETLDQTKAAVFRDARMAAELEELRDMIGVIYREGLNRKKVF